MFCAEKRHHIKKIRNSNLEIRNKFQIPNSNFPKVLNFNHSVFGFVSDLGFRVLDLKFTVSVNDS